MRLHGFAPAENGREYRQFPEAAYIRFFRLRNSPGIHHIPLVPIRKANFITVE